MSAQVSEGIVIAVRGSDSRGDVIEEAESESRVPEAPCLEHNRHERRSFREARSLSCCVGFGSGCSGLASVAVRCR